MIASTTRVDTVDARHLARKMFDNSFVVRVLCACLLPRTGQRELLIERICLPSTERERRELFGTQAS